MHVPKYLNESIVIWLLNIDIIANVNKSEHGNDQPIIPSPKLGVTCLNPFLLTWKANHSSGDESTRYPTRMSSIFFS